MPVTLTKGKDTITLSDEIQIRAYEQSGYKRIKEASKKPARKQGETK